MKTRLSICNRKARYVTEQDAFHAATAATIPLRPYRCDRCRQYHLTSRTKGKRMPHLLIRHSRESGDPAKTKNLGSRFRGNDDKATP